MNDSKCNIETREDQKASDYRWSRSGEWPGEEFLHPLPMAAMVVLGINDHLLKGSGLLPGMVTGILSDFAGLIFFPLFLTALLNTLMFTVFRIHPRIRWNYSLTRSKLLGALGLTALVFAPLQFSKTWADWYIRLMETIDFLDLFGGFAVTPDLWDLTALSTLPLVYWFGKRKIRNIPNGRLPVLRRRMERVAPNMDAMKLVFQKGTRDIRSISGEKGEISLDRLKLEFCRYVLDPTADSGENVQKALDDLRKTI